MRCCVHHSSLLPSICVHGEIFVHGENFVRAIGWASTYVLQKGFSSIDAHLFCWSSYRQNVANVCICRDGGQLCGKYWDSSKLFVIA